MLQGQPLKIRVFGTSCRVKLALILYRSGRGADTEFSVNQSGQPKICSSPNSTMHTAIIAKVNRTRRADGGLRAHLDMRNNRRIFNTLAPK